MNKLFTKIAALALGAVMAVGVGVAVASGSKANVVNAASYTEAFTIKSSDVVTNSGYQAYNTTVGSRDWVITFGGNNKSVGTNNNNRSNCNLSSYTKYAVSPVTTSVVASAFASKTSISNIGKISYTFNGGSNQTSTNVYLLYSSDNSTFSQISLNSGTQGASISSGTAYTFTKCNGYFAVLMVATNSSGNWRIDDVDITFYTEDATTKTLSKIEVAASPAPKTSYVVGESFTKPTITATYSDSSTADVTNSATFSGFDSSSAVASQTISVSYTEGGTTKNTSYTIEIVNKALTSISVSGQTVSYAKGATFTFDGICTAHYSNAADATVTPTSVSNPDMSSTGTKTITVSYTESGVTKTTTYDITVSSMTTVTDIINYDFTGISGSGYKAWSDKTGTSGAVYAGQSNAGVSYVQIRSTNPSGIVSTTSGGAAKSVKVTWGGNNTNGRVVTFYGKNTAYSEPADLYDNSTMGTSAGSVTFSTGASSATTNLTGDYSFIGIKANGAAYMTSIEITWAQAQEEKEVTGIEVSDNSGKTWYAGDSLSVSDLRLEVTYDSGDPAVITDGTGVYFDSNHTQTTYTLSQGTNSITVYYTDEFGSADNSSEPLSITAGAARNLSSISVTTAPSKTTYNEGESFSKTGMVVTATFSAGPTADVTDDCIITPSGALTLGTTSVTISYTYKEVEKTTTQAIIVNVAPVTIVFGTTSGQWQPTASGSTFEDSKGNTATLTTDTSYFGTSKPIQVGKNNKDNVVYAATYVEIVIPLSSKAGIDSVSATFKSNGASSSVYLYIYGDTDNDLLASGSVTGNTDLGTVSTSVSYEKINASRLKYRFEIGGTGVMLDEISYQLGSVVAEFGTMTSLSISIPASNNQFKEGDTFSGAGIVLLATDDSVPAKTKNITSGLKFGTSQGDDSFTGHEFDATDAATGSFTVYVTATVGSVTMSVTYTITVTEVPTYSPVSDYSSLYEGAKVIIVAGESAFGEFGLNQGGVVSPVFTDGNVTDANGATEFTVRIYGNRFGLQFGEYYLALNGDNNQVHRNLELNDAGSWTKDSSGISSSVEGRYLALDTNKFICLKTGGVACALFISDKAPKTDILGAETFAYKYLHLRDYTVGDGSCMNDSANHYYSTAKTQYGNLTSQEKTAFAGLTDAVARLQDWAKANSETFDPSAKTFTLNSNKVIIETIVGNGSNTIALIVVITMISATAIGGYFFLRKRKEN